MTTQDIAAGRVYALGTHFCFPPLYVALMQRAKDTEASWCWTRDIASAHGFISKEAAEASRSDPQIAALLSRLGDDAAQRRIQALKVELKVVPAA